MEDVALYFSEIAWMGTEVSANDEWIELYNPNDFSVDLSGWTIATPDSDFEILLSDVIDPLDYFLLERTDDESVPDIDADQIYTGALSNDGVHLQLINSFETIIDEIDLWHSGDNESKATMARSDFELFGTDSFAWCTSDPNSPSAGNTCSIPDETEDPDLAEDIPPSGENNPPVPIIKIQGDTNYMHVNVTGDESYDPDGDNLIYFWDYGDGFVSERENPKSYYYETPGQKTITLTVTDEFGLSAIVVDTSFVAREKSNGGNSSGGHVVAQPEFTDPPKSHEKGVVVIDSVLANPEGRDNGLELMVLKNKSNEIINLNGWKIIDAKENSKIFESVDIPPQSSLQINQDIFKINLNNDEETVYLYDPAGNLINQMSWTDAASGEWIQNLSFLYDGISALVLEIIDGDTFKIDLEGQIMSVRIIGVDTPETVHPYRSAEEYGYEASDYLKDLLEGMFVSLSFDEDKTDVYGRLLAYVYMSEVFVNAEIIKQGYGYAYTKYPFKYLDDFIKYEEQARSDGVGIWSSDVIVEIVEDEVDEEDLIAEEIVEESIIPEGAMTSPHLQEQTKCLSDFLKIDSILPAPQKGEAVEFIRLINTGPEIACLDGWSLDDVVDGGSKSFAIRGGSIAPGGMRTFRKDETGLALNNSNDCATLIGPDGETMDQICYNKTHKNEIFTHDGGDWVAKPKISTTTQKTSSKSTKREVIAYKYDLETERAIGNLELVYEDGELMYLTLDNNSMIQISYAGSSVDMGMAKQLLDITQPIEVQYLSGGELNQLISIDQISGKEEPIENTPSFLYLFGLLPISGTLFWWRKKYY